MGVINSLSSGSNLASLRAQRNLFGTNRSLGRNFEKLSSGLRIVRAGDDAAGLCLSENMRARSALNEQGIRNINDGISVLDIADKALGELTNIATRIAELSEQAANGVYGRSQRKALDQEANDLVDEYNRVLATTSFGDRKLLDLSTDDFSIQLGEGGQYLGLDLGSEIARNKGTGEYEAAITASNGRIIAVADFNDDGIDDVMSQLSRSADIQLNLGSELGGDLTLNSEQTLSFNGAGFATDEIIDATADDFNGDGRLDMVAIGIDGQPFWGRVGMVAFTQSADGSFNVSDQMNYSTTVESYGVEDIESADFNGDGAKDLVYTITDMSGGLWMRQIVTAMGRGDGTFEDPVFHLSAPFDDPSTYGFVAEIDVGDINGDGNLDLVSATRGGSGDTDPATGGVFALFGDGEGGFSTDYKDGVGLGLYGATGVSIEDFNRDGLLDIAVGGNGSTNGSHIHFLDGQQLTSGEAFSDLSWEQITADAHRILPVDANTDGVKDIFTVDNYNTPAPGVMLFDEDGNVAEISKDSRPDRDLSLGAAASWGGALYTGDLNGDGVDDIVNSDNKEELFTSKILYAETERTTDMKYVYLHTQEGAREALDMARDTIDKLSLERGKLGSMESRLQSAADNLATVKLGTDDARSRIADVDVAEESTNFTRNNIKQQAGTSILAQANQQPQMVLSLMG